MAIENFIKIRIKGNSIENFEDANVFKKQLVTAIEMGDFSIENMHRTAIKNSTSQEIERTIISVDCKLIPIF